MSSLLFEFKNLSERVQDIEQDKGSEDRNIIKEAEKVVDPVENSTESSTQMLHYQKNLYFLQITNSIPVLSGKNNSVFLESYFQKFELVTKGFSIKEKADILATKLEDRFWIIYKNLSQTDKMDYFVIKNKILNSCSSSSKIISQRKLFSGIKKRVEESFPEFGERLIKNTREGLPSTASEDVVEEIAINQFFDNIDNPHILSSLALKREEYSFYQLIEEASKLYDLHGVTQKNIYYKSTFNNFAKPIISNFSKQTSEKRVNSVQNSNLIPIKSVGERQNNSQSFLFCIFCAKQHSSSSCLVYKSIESRIKRLESCQRCSKCTRRGHNSNSCFVKLQCSSCPNSKHHPFLCPKGNQSSVFLSSLGASQEPNKDTETSQVYCNVNESSQPSYQSIFSQVSQVKSAVLLKCIRCLIHHPLDSSISFSALVLFDDGSTTSYISSSLAKNLHLPRVCSEDLRFNVFNERSYKTIKSDVVSFKISLISGGTKQIVARTVDYIGSSVPHLIYDSSLLSSSEQSNFNTLYGVPDILIGGDFYYDFNIIPCRSLSSGLVLLNSDIGSIVAGKFNNVEKNLSFDSVFFSKAVSSEQQFARIYDLETIGITDDPLESPSLSTFKNIACFNGERYEVALPWKTFPPIRLDNNFGLSLGRLKSTLRFLKSKPYLLGQYKEIFLSQLENGIIERVDRWNDKELVYYIPHQPVYKEGKDKIRVVYDASARPNKGCLSLNQCLHTGPLLLQNLTGILLRFRLYSVVVLADIEKAFHQVALREKDRDFTRFLWVNDQSQTEFNLKNLVVYRFCRVVFGLTCSPHLLSSTIHLHFSENVSKYSEEVLLNLYVDNLLLSAPDAKTVNHKSLEVKAEFHKIGMNLREFISNDSKALEGIKNEDKLSSSTIKVLGVLWNSSSDHIIFKISSFSINQVISKQSILSYIAGFFDPFGFLCPAILPLKLFF